MVHFNAADFIIVYEPVKVMQKNGSMSVKILFEPL